MKDVLHAEEIADAMKEEGVVCKAALALAWLGQESGSMKLCGAFQKSAEHVPLFQPGQHSTCTTIGSVLKAYRFLSVPIFPRPVFPKLFNQLARDDDPSTSTRVMSFVIARLRSCTLQQALAPLAPNNCQ